MPKGTAEHELLRHGTVPSSNNILTIEKEKCNLLYSQNFLKYFITKVLKTILLDSKKKFILRCYGKIFNTIFYDFLCKQIF